MSFGQGTDQPTNVSGREGDAIVAGAPIVDAPATTGRRVFRIVDGGQTTDLEDPLPGAPDDRVIGVLRTQISRLVGATQETRIEGDARVVVLTVRTGTKG